ncbi:MAG: molecular chaperone DnaJ [Parcubacteria group bacterium CG10_big_fil_rev_8_21_14_0_10_36_14]|nr:MAG: molecular chaperone DnaJ [Parcubacteria group bacterium CG10_big_fil_rev_8_21_14_0_10_36_14]
MEKDYYKILDLSRSASADEIKRRFRELAHKYHPDKPGGDAEKFKEINEAYQVLNNAERRKQYDQYGTTFDNFGGFNQQNPFSGSGNFGGQRVNINMDDLGDIFGDLFGMGSRTRTKTHTRGGDIEMNLGLTFKESIQGVEKKIEIYKNAKCEACQGSGAEPGTKITTCSECNGAGSVRRVQNTMFGSFATNTTCPRCRGEGNQPDELCKKCKGAGILKKSVSLKINVPAGISDGEILRVTGGGEAGEKGGVPGDLYLHINVGVDRRFERDGNNIITRTPLDFKTATLGGHKEVETLDGKMRVKIPAGTASGQLFRLKGYGVAGRGDMLVEMYITVPKKISKKQKKILEDWE